MKNRRAENRATGIDQHIRKSRLPTEDEKLMDLVGKSICRTEENDDKKSLPIPPPEKNMFREKQGREHRENTEFEHMRTLALQDIPKGRWVQGPRSLDRRETENHSHPHEKSYSIRMLGRKRSRKHTICFADPQPP
jgi:hypothetical protein